MPQNVMYENSFTPKKKKPKTTFVSVSLDVIQDTPIWKQYKKEDGTIPAHKFKQVLKAALYQLGFDINHSAGYKKVSGKVMLRDPNDLTKGTRSYIYKFPVRPDFKYRQKYESLGFIHYNKNNKNKEDLSSFGLSHYKETAKDEEIL